ncbi:hypothetical protein EPA93_25280 [Ktedonosporobacter rubrisoli]|uniref:Uncharacterized protein n=1 Tax=Ktedonosporobacter rubrisoli TaxID=2509675 RepID=A0A4P6JUR9_KTERU|nr:hypothetical protein [Ktedonosporobacter rubrisoli]QBD79115.1 hypothetical protein EPA93_25280 [Ktedonosporobacter rubrisoli]
MQHCLECGVSLPSGANICPNCHTQLPYKQRIASTYPIQDASPPAPLSRPSAVPETPPPGSQKSYPTRPLAPHQLASSATPSPYSPEQPGRRGLSKGMAILLFCISLLLLFSGLGLIFYTSIARPNQLRAEATATVQTLLTGDARSTTTANVQSTATAQAYTRVTATAHTQATVEAAATATALQQLYLQATGGSPVLYSPLAHQDRADWDIYDATGGGGCSFAHGALHASVQQKQFYAPCFAHATNFHNFAFQVEMTILKGDEGGLVFRANNSNAHFYYFRVGRDGLFSLFIAKDDRHSMAITFDTSRAIKTDPGDSNLLTVVAKDNNFYLYINKQFVGSANDSTYSVGQIGIFAGDNTNPTDVAFQNARVWILP